MTLPHLAWELWSSALKETVEITNDMEKYKFITASKYGGRCYPMGRKFKSKLYDDVTMKKVTYEELMMFGDFIFNADCSGLYPASMSGNELMKVVYPTGKSRWSDKPEYLYYHVDEIKRFHGIY